MIDKINEQGSKPLWNQYPCTKIMQVHHQRICKYIIYNIELGVRLKKDFEEVVKWYCCKQCKKTITPCFVRKKDMIVRKQKQHTAHHRYLLIEKALAYFIYKNCGKWWYQNWQYPHRKLTDTKAFYPIVQNYFIKRRIVAGEQLLTYCPHIHLAHIYRERLIAAKGLCRYI